MKAQQPRLLGERDSLANVADSMGLRSGVYHPHSASWFSPHLDSFLKLCVRTLQRLRIQQIL